ncbi:8126_t:CDS:2 [Funneliformis caledonium]|uniref:8126_t:CDS:1 n=1 Tax=Funneliformis caledonium TaxID=1117310 RepID=A0A9N9EXG0_9GLOM|nr:8126_t:CDS:2 [Funneliformis caledonium]
MSFTFICWSLFPLGLERPSFGKSKFPVDNEEELQNLTLQDNEALAGAREIRHYWDSTPPKKNIHIIIKPPATGKYYQRTLFELTFHQIDEIYKKITQPAIETISISKVSSENFRLFKAHLNFKLKTVFFDNLPTPSKVSIQAFKWIEKQSEPVYKEEYMNWLRENIPLTGHRVWHDVEINKQLLNYKNPRLPFIIHGGTDVVVVNDFDIKEMFVFDSLTSNDRKVFGILSNLIDDWHILWLLRDRSGVDMEDTSIIIPGSIRVKLDTLLPVHTSLIDDVARMEDVYDVMSKEEIWRHKAGIASDIVRNMPSFMSIDAEV